MEDTIPLPPRFQPHTTVQRHSSLPPNDKELTRGFSIPRTYTPPSRLVAHPSPSLVDHLRPSLSRRVTSPQTSSYSSPPNKFDHPDRRISAPPASQLAHAHQLAAETLLSMGPGSGPSASPEKRTDSSTPVPAPVNNGRATPQSSDDQRGIKRKNEDEDPSRSRPSPALGLNGVDKDKPMTRSPLTTHDKPSGLGARPGQGSILGSSTSSGLLGSRYSIYGPTARDSLATSPWAALSQRYNSLGLRRDMSPAVPTTTPKSNAPSSSALSPPRRPSPDPMRDASRLYPGAASTSTAPAGSTSAMAGYGHYAMGRRELQEHREQLREGKRWLETMLLKTEKMLHMVENKMALAPNDAKHSEDWEFEERERARQKEIERLEAERERDRAEREKRERERERTERERVERERLDRERDHVAGGLGNFFGRDRSLAALNRERSEAERNRDLLLASRRVTAVSPNGRERSTPGAPAAGTAPATSSNGSNGASGGNAPGTGSLPSSSGVISGERKPGSWDGEPVMSGVALPRRDQGMRLGRGLWSFDVRG